MKRVTPLGLIRKYCLESCMNGQRALVDTCEDTGCPLYACRSKAVEAENFAVRPARIIRKFCLACLSGDTDKIRECSAGEDCLLWPYRFGVTPATLARMRKRLSAPRRLTLPGL